MPILTCPRCGNSGEIRGEHGRFEDVWPGARGHLPLRKCSQCGAGIIVSTKLLALGMRATVIPDDIWVRMREENFGRPMAAVPIVHNQFVCDRCGADFDSERALENHARHAHS
jgi:ribosomal protein S27AE